MTYFFHLLLIIASPLLAKAIEIALPSKPEYSEIVQLIEQGQNEQALNQIATRRKLRAADPNLLLLKVVALKQAAKFVEAQGVVDELAWFNTREELEPDTAEILRADIAMLQGNDTLALSSLNKALSANSKRVETRIALAQLMLKSADYPSAISHLRAALSERPDSPSVKLLLAQALTNSGDRLLKRKELDDAKALLTSLLKQAELNSEQRRNVSILAVQLFSKLGQVEAAQRALNPLLKAEPQNPEVLALKEQIQIDRKLRESAEGESAEGESAEE